MFPPHFVRRQHIRLRNIILLFNVRTGMFCSFLTEHSCMRRGGILPPLRSHPSAPASMRLTSQPYSASAIAASTSISWLRLRLRSVAVVFGHLFGSRVGKPTHSAIKGARIRQRCGAKARAFGQILQCQKIFEKMSS